MKLVWHIFKKDLRRLSWPLVLWGAVIVMQYIAWRATRAESAGDAAHGSGNLVMVLWVVHLIAAWLLVPQLMRDDPLIGDRAGWRVRPISGARLLAAKLLGLLVMFCLWPSLLTELWWIDFGFGVGEVARAIAVNMLGMALFTGLALMVTVLTENLARYIAWSIVMIVAAGLGWLVLVADLPANGDGAVSAALIITRASLAFGLFLAIAPVVVVMQFLGRRTGLARGIVVAAAVLVALIVEAWPWTAAEMLARTGVKRYALPTVTARLGVGALVVPADPTRQMASVRVTTEFELKGVMGSDFPKARDVEPKWRFGDRRLTSPPIWAGANPNLHPTALALAQGRAGEGDSIHRTSWTMDLPGPLVTQLRDGGGALSSTNDLAIWRGEVGPSAKLRGGAGGARGLEQLHVMEVIRDRRYSEWGYLSGEEVSWLQTAPLFTSTAMLELMNADGMHRNRHRSALLMNGTKSIFDVDPMAHFRGDDSYLPGQKIPVGLIGVRMLISSFDRWWDEGRDAFALGLINEGSTLTSVTFQEATQTRVAQVETPFLPELIVEGRLADALRRAKAEEKLVLVRVPERRMENGGLWIPESWVWDGVKELLVSRFVVVQVGPEEAKRWRKPGDDDQFVELVVLRSDGTEQDRLIDLSWFELQRALQANVEGKTYAADLAERLAKLGTDDRNLRLQLHQALRMRGDLAGALDAIISIMDHPGPPFEGTDIFGVGSRIEGFVKSFPALREVLIERREQAVAMLRQDPRSVGAARMLLALTLGLRHEEAVWRDFPRVMPRENASWWEFTRNWISLSVREKRYQEVVRAVDLEKFFAEGPAWVRTQLLQKRPLTPNGPPATFLDWQRQLTRAGTLSIEALAAAGQPEAALRVARAVMRMNSGSGVRDMLVAYLHRNGAKAEAAQLALEKNQ